MIGRFTSPPGYLRALHVNLLAVLIVSISTYVNAETSSVTLEYLHPVRLPESIHGIARPVAVTTESPVRETCITDALTPAIHVVNDRDVAVFRTSRFSGLGSPLDACIEEDGSIVFLDLDRGAGGMTIRRLNLHAEPTAFTVERVASHWNPGHLCLCGDGGLLTLDTDEGWLAKHDPRDGSLVWKTNLTGSETDELFLGRPCEGPDGRIFVPGGELHSVLVLSPEGERIGEFGEFGTGPGKMIFPVAVGFGPRDTIVVLDRMRHKIMVHDADLRFLAEFGSFGAGPGQMYHPNSLAVSDDGRVFVAQGYEGRVQVYQLAVRSRP